ncbi:Guanosine-3',5'-bis(diphosphate) 3'-pyrophosphohydrolase / GTP pyrophosphokinase, (p)ppGpp synthetase II [hydrothermal vent metagenome]|uniref:Guanosine-3',5'-bis(Diphosphate) 3'-pyrophosphohydrolase / GTP pyrophosphokinase, (P)ppGpp synthetase II n=1 Tax=hydrothermal vent metagenome TaxID=652676 RepID=A0A3B0UPN7_9ZZZZ
MDTTQLEEENKELIRKYRKLLRHAKPFLKDDDSKMIRKAFNLAMEAHEGMRRKSGEPYIYHPVEVAQICVEEIGLGTTSIIAALLHDVVEDTDYEVEDIEREFGKKAAQIIDGLTKISVVGSSADSGQAENFRKMLLTLSHDVRVILVKLADRLHNMRTLDSMPRHKQLKIASETIFLYAPLAHRLGLYAIKSEMEDLHLKYTHQEIYQSIIDNIKITKEVRDRFIRRFIRPIQQDLSLHNFKFTIKGRVKSVHSIWEKMQKQDISVEEVFDLFAVRIIVDVPLNQEKAVCWQVYSIVTDFYKPNPDRLRDWVSTPKANGYESLHTTVMSRTGKWVEVQIRTKRMDDIAEKGYAAHWKYKDNPTRKTSGLETWIAEVRDLLENNSSDAIEFVDEFKSNLYQDEVFVFTPKGDLKTLQHGATTLDFAFDIHTEVGLKCLGAKVNQKLVPLNYVLQNGDQIEILTSNKQKPSENWLRFVVTSKARSGIKHGLKDETRQIAEEGKEIVLRKLKQLKIEHKTNTFTDLTKFFGLVQVTDFLYRVGKGIIAPKEIKKFKDAAVEKKIVSKYKNWTDAKQISKLITKETGRDDSILFIGEDLDLVEYKFATCCNPIPGDDVFGFVTIGDGIKIHRTICPNAAELLSKHGHRVLKAKWESVRKESFEVGLEIIGTDRVGLINDVTKIISNEHKVNMKSITVDTDTGIFEGKIYLYIKNKEYLAQLAAKLENVEGVVKVSRIKED